MVVILKVKLNMTKSTIQIYYTHSNYFIFSITSLYTLHIQFTLVPFITNYHKFFKILEIFWFFYALFILTMGEGGGEICQSNLFLANTQMYFMNYSIKHSELKIDVHLQKFFLSFSILLLFCYRGKHILQNTQ